MHAESCYRKISCISPSKGQVVRAGVGEECHVVNKT
jgi:hypothetical protein